MVNVHNKFKIVVKDAETNEIKQEGFAENIVLDRMYERLCNFYSYFSNIVFGRGTGTPTPDRTTLFNQIGYKSATTEELIRAYPISKWTRSARLGTTEYNGETITEIGISETSTNINTHALIKDSEGNPLAIEKTSTNIIDLYATVYVSVYNVDSGLFFYDDTLRNYLTGSSSPSNTLAISYLNDPSTISGSRTADVDARTVTITGRFEEGALNKEVKMIDWRGLGLRCMIPRIGVFNGVNRTGVKIGDADGVTTTFTLPQTHVSDVVVKVDNAVNNNWTKELNTIVFDSAPATGEITADYFCELIPKDENHVLDVSMSINFATSEPAPVMPDISLPSDLPGNSELIAGDNIQGFFGEVSETDLISGDDLAAYLGFTAGYSLNEGSGWVKSMLDGRLLYTAKKTFRRSVSWNDINAVNAIYGERLIEIGGHTYAIRLLTSEEWDRVIQPLHVDGIQPRLHDYGDIDLYVNYSVSGGGTYTWTSTPDGSSRVSRGYISVSSSISYSPSYSNSNVAWRPVLEFIA